MHSQYAFLTPLYARALHVHVRVHVHELEVLSVLSRSNKFENQEMPISRRRSLGRLARRLYCLLRAAAEQFMASRLQRIGTAAADFTLGGIICAVGDVGAQALESGGGLDAKSFDKQRTAIVSAYGAVVCAPYHFWYKYLAYAFPGSTGRAVLGKTACEIGIALPLFELPAFTLWSGALAQGKTWQENVAALRAGWLDGYMVGVCIWAPASLATFAVFTQPRSQLFVFYCAGSMWTCAISFLSFREQLNSSPEPDGRQRLGRRRSTGEV